MLLIVYRFTFIVIYIYIFFVWVCCVDVLFSLTLQSLIDQWWTADDDDAVIDAVTQLRADSSRDG